MRSEPIETAGGTAGRLRMQFTWCNDRYGHVVSLVNSAGQIENVLESIEGPADDAWPPSPPLQSLSIEELPDGRSAALLVGMAGRSHWSASVEPAAGEAKLVFDIACRHSHEPKWLGNRYRRLSGGAEDLSIDAEGAQVIADGDLVSIRPLAIANGAATTRWKFTVSMRPAADRPAPAEATEPRR